MPVLTGAHLIAGQECPASAGARTFAAISPYTAHPIGPSFPEATATEVDRAVSAAVEASRHLRSVDHHVFADLLEAISVQVEQIGAELITTADRETAIGADRLRGELGRTTGQLRMVGRWVRRGEPLEVTIDHADPSAVPPRPDLRRLLVSLGPVAVFGASNFPLAFSVGGGDTASAIGAGCPVVVKAHPGHPATSQLAGRAISAAVSACGLHPGTFSLLHGAGTDVGAALVTHPGITAVGFTGSLAGGRALYDLATQRPAPIPVYAEMGSANPLVVTGGAIRERGDLIASGLGASLLLGSGQFCTSPGLVFIPTGRDADAFVAALVSQLECGPRGNMLTPSVLQGLRTRISDTREHPEVRVLYEDPVSENHGLRHPVTMLATTARAVACDPQLVQEHFGPVSLVVRYSDAEELTAALRTIDGTLTFTVQAADDEVDSLRDIFDVMNERAGRIIWNGYPTGVAVAHAMHHGGPYPATTSPLHTSVGATAVRRFQRPVAFQDTPAALLPAALREDNPLRLPRRIDGALESAP